MNDRPTDYTCFINRFPDHQEYRDPTTIDINEPGWLVDYISSTFLNGWINYVKPVKAYVIARYRNGEKLAERVEAFKKEQPPHTDLYYFQDDVHILAHSDSKEPGAANDWWYFHFDCDVSDCSIGRFQDSNKDEVLKDFELYMKWLSYETKKYPTYSDQDKGDGTIIELDVSLLRGWMKF